MDLTDKKTIKKILKKHCLAVRKRAGQHFLISKKILSKMVESAHIDNQLIVEVGTGLGTLTKELSKKAKKVITFEIDKGFVALLKETLKNHSNITIINQDFLKANLNKIIGRKRFSVVSSLPYYITSPVIQAFLKLTLKPKEMVLLVQKEVAQRICARPPKMNLLGLAVQTYGKPKIIFHVSQKAFFPRPKVESAIIKIIPYAKLIPSAEKLLKLAKIGFASRRKQLHNNFTRGLGLSSLKTKGLIKAAGLDPKIRAQELNLSHWERLSQQFINYL